MYCHKSIPELDIMLYRAFEQEMVRRLEIRRLRDLNRIGRPQLRDRLLLRAGAALVAGGEWLKERSHLAAPNAQFAR